MSREQEMLVREIKQLWCVAGVYLRRARTLENEKRKHEEVWHTFEKGRVSANDLRALRSSADLASAAIRLASLEERLIGNGRRLWKLAYSGQRSTYVHVYLRDAVAHAEPRFTGDARWARRQRWLGTQHLKDTLRYLQDVQRRLRAEVDARFGSTSDVGSWLAGEAPRWIVSMGR